MLSKLKISTVDQWRGKMIRPVFLFLTITLVIAYPKLSHSASNKLTKYLAGAMQNVFKKSPEGKRSTKNSEETALSESEERLYQRVKTILEHQKRLESTNEELTEKLALKNGIIRSLEYNEQILLSQLEAKEHHGVKELTDKLALKDRIIKTLQNSEDTLKAQLKDDKRKFETALSAIDPEYQPTEERASLMSNSLFGYSPPATNKTTDNDHLWGSLVCITCHDGNSNYGNKENIPANINESSKKLLWENNIDVSDYIISNNLNSNEEITNSRPTSDNFKEDSISTLRTWTSTPPSLSTCNDQESDSVCAEDSKTDSWWHWFNQKISKLKTNVAETVYSYL